MRYGAIVLQVSRAGRDLMTFGSPFPHRRHIVGCSCLRLAACTLPTLATQSECVCALAMSMGKYDGTDTPYFIGSRYSSSTTTTRFGVLISIYFVGQFPSPRCILLFALCSHHSAYLLLVTDKLSSWVDVHAAARTHAYTQSQSHTHTHTHI